MWTISRALGKYTFLQAREEVFSPDIFSAGAPSALSRSTSSAVRFLSPDKTTGLLTHSRYGMTYALLTGDRGEDAVKSCVEVFRARMCHHSETERVYAEPNPACGERWRELQARYPRPMFSSRTPPASRNSGSTSCYETLTRSGTMLNGSAYPVQISAPLTSGTGYGFLAPNDSPDYTKTLRRVEATVADILAGKSVKLPEKRFEFWPTPTRSDARNTGSPKQLLRKYIPLSCRVRITDDGRFNASGGRTNPEFVEWLMGWPMGWTGLKRLGMDKFLTWRQARFAISRDGSKQDPCRIDR